MSIFQRRVLRGLTRDEEEAMLLWLRILGPRCSAQSRAGMEKSIYTSIHAGRWWATLRLWEAALLFYPYDRAKEAHFLSLLERAADEGELVVRGDPPVVSSASLAGWTACPPVPADSALKLWLPSWMSHRIDDLTLAESLEDSPQTPKTIAALPMSRAALVGAHEHHWPSLKRDLADAANNGLALAAKSEQRGWFELAALAWARSKNKLMGEQKTAPSIDRALHNMNATGIRRHTLKD